MVRLTHGESSLGEEVAADQEVETAANESTKVQNPRRNSTALCTYTSVVYILRMRVYTSAE